MSIIEIGKAVEGVGASIGNAVEKVGGVFTSNAENDAERSAQEQMAVLEQYKAEFHERDNRTWIDALADGFNRLIRPFIVTIIISIFIISYISPDHFTKITLAISSIPQGYWTLLSIIIAFYFGGRMQIKSQDFKFKREQAQAIETLIKTKKAFRDLEIDDDEPDKTVGEKAAKKPQINQTRAEQANDVTDIFLKMATDQGKTEAQKKTALKAKVDALANEEPETLIARRKNGPRRNQPAGWPMSAAVNR